MDEGVGRPSTYIECLQFFVAPTDLAGNHPDPDRQPDVIGNSYDCPAAEWCDSTSLHQALENVRAAGIFVAAAAGNNGPGCGSINSPPGLDALAVTVGSVDANDAIAFDSSRGRSTNQLQDWAGWRRPATKNSGDRLVGVALKNSSKRICRSLDWTDRFTP